MRWSEVATLKWVLIVVVQVPLLARGDRLTTPGADRPAGRHDRRVLRPNPPVLSTYAHLLPQSDEIAAERVAAALAR